MIKWALIGWLFLKEVVECFLKFSNLNYATSPNRSIPSTLQDVITQEKFEKSKSYLKDKTWFSFVSSLFHLLFTLVLLLLLLPMFEQVALIATKSFIIQGLLFFGLLFLIDTVVNIPFSLYETFVIEHKFGFNKTTGKTFVADQVKSILISLVLGTLLLSVILWVLKNFTVWWWQISLGSIVFLLISMWLFPMILMPLFNKFKPLPEGELKTIIEEFALKNHINVKNIFIMDASKRSTHGNAFFTGAGSSRRLVLFDTILGYSPDEILSIVAHEWGHFLHRDTWKLLTMEIFITTSVLFLSNYLYASSILGTYFHITTRYATLFYSMTFITPLLFFLEPAINFWVRKNEYDADLFSIRMTGKASAGISSLKRLIKDNLSNLNPLPLYRTWFYSHPAPEERIAFIARNAKDE